MNPIETWLSARDADSLYGAWTALAARPLAAVTPPMAYISEHATARLAAELLGWPVDRVGWLTTNPYAPSQDGPPVQSIHRTTTRCYLENAVDLSEACSEQWTVREVRDGARGVQRVTVGFGIEDGSRDGVGGGGAVVRVFDLDAGFAVSVALSGRDVSLVAPDEGARAALETCVRRALDLFRCNRSMHQGAWARYDYGRMRALIASLATSIDVGFGGSADWNASSTAIRVPTGHYESRVVSVNWRFDEPGPGRRALVLKENYRGVAAGDARFGVSASVEGLPWGSMLAVSGDVGPDGTLTGVLQMCLPRADLDAVCAAFASTGEAVLG